MHSGMVLGAPGTSAYPPITSNSSADTIWWFASAPFNWADENGVMMDGPGQIHPSSTIVNNGNPNIGSLISTAPVHDVLGGMGFFPGSSASDIFIQGGAFAYESGQVVVDQWNCDAGGGGPYHRVEWNDDYTVDGSNSLKVTKTFGSGSGPLLRLLVPVQPGKNIMGGLRFLFPHDYSPVDPDATTDIYYLTFWEKVIGFDQWNRPIFAPIDSAMAFKGEVDLHPLLAGSPDWVTRGFTTLYSPPSSDVSAGRSNFAPAWANYLGIHIDCQTMPAGFTFYIARFLPNTL
jgi:hypothetical protein